MTVIHNTILFVFPKTWRSIYCPLGPFRFIEVGHQSVGVQFQRCDRSRFRYCDALVDKRLVIHAGATSYPGIAWRAPALMSDSLYVINCYSRLISKLPQEVKEPPGDPWLFITCNQGCSSCGKNFKWPASLHNE